MNRFLLVVCALFLLSFTVIGTQFSAQEIIDKTIVNAGGAKYDHSIIDFTFRGKQYRSSRSDGNYRLERIVTHGDEEIRDVLGNRGLSRSIDNCLVKVPDSLVSRISDGVNSVHYFAYLPYGLNAPAVHKKYVGEITVKGEGYYKIKVTFDQEGGGTDYDDEFMYWIHKDHFTVDYLAYKYAVNGGGIRFREAFNSRIVNGIRFVDYNNYKAKIPSTDLSDLDKMFEDKKLTLLSTIALEDIYVYVE